MQAIDNNKFKYDGKVMIVEDKWPCMLVNGVTEIVIDLLQIDTALLTGIGEPGYALTGSCQFVIVVYDQDDFMNHRWRDAIIAHEIGHVKYKFGHGYGVISEIIADFHAIRLGYGKEMIEAIQAIIAKFGWRGKKARKAYKRRLMAARVLNTIYSLLKGGERQ